MTKNENSYSSTQLKSSLKKINIPYKCLYFSQLAANIGFKPYLTVSNTNIIKELDALIIRPIGRGSLQEIIFRMDMLHRLQRLGLYIINPPKALERCVDKYASLALLEEHGIPVPSTVVTENVDEALKAFNVLGRDIVIKPIFGSRGMGSTRINDPEIASTIFKAVTFYHGVIYIQEYVPHGSSDIRAFVIGDRIVAAMRRVANSWKTNYSQGARPIAIKLEKEIEKLAIESAKCIECKIAGVDILEGPKGPLINEINSQPGWKGLQSVSKINIADEIVSFILSELKK
jgi:RimK family alpha-L-glutamate ligase